MQRFEKSAEYKVHTITQEQDNTKMRTSYKLDVLLEEGHFQVHPRALWTFAIGTDFFPWFFIKVLCGVGDKEEMEGLRTELSLF